MSWMVTSTGLDFSLAMPAPGAVFIMDVAWHLAQINRFSGATLRPYSVAEHSLLVLSIAKHNLGLDVHGQYAALLHDAHEAYTGDVTSPVKHMLGDEWFRFERHLESTVRTAFGTHVAMGVHGAAIKRADLIALATERRDLLRHNQPNLPWPVLNDVLPCNRVNLRDKTRSTAGWEEWRDAFLDAFHDLHAQRQALKHGCSRHDAHTEGAST